MAFIGKSPNVKRTRYTPQAAAPSNPAEGDTFYSDGTALSEGLFVYKNGIWKEVGSQVGSVNYIENSSAESGITDWNEYDDGASATPIDGTGGTAANLTLAVNTTAPLRGVSDFKLSKGAADAQGEGISYDFTIDAADTSRSLTISFDYNVTANYADNDMGVYIYDVTNAAIINVTSKNILDNANNTTFTTTFTTTTSTSYRLIFHVQSTNATAYDLQFDNVITGSILSNPAELTVVTAKLDLTSGTHTSTANWQDIPFNVSTFDTASIISGATFVIPETGYYFLNASVGFGGSSGTTPGLRFVINGSSNSRTSYSSNITPIMNISQVYFLTIGDIVKMQALQNSGGSLAYDTTNDTWMNIFKIR